MLKVETITDVTHMLSAQDLRIFDATRRIVDERHYLRTSYPEAMDMFDPFPVAEGSKPCWDRPQHKPRIKGRKR